MSSATIPQQISIADRVRSCGAAILVLLAGAAALSIFGARLVSVLELGGVASATGMEGTSVYAISRACRGINVYGALPDDLNVYMYNFLFYDVYGQVASLFSDCGTQATQVSRLFSTLLVIVAACVIFTMARREGCKPLIAVFLAVAPLGPLIGWWAFGIRPDVAAFLATLASLSLALSSVRSGNAVIAGASVVCVFVAFAFKQTYALAIPFVVGYLLVCARSSASRWSAVAVSVACSTFILAKLGLDHGYFLHTVEFPANRRFHFPLLISNTALFVAKAAPYLLLWAIALGIVVVRSHKTRPSPSMLYLGVGSVALLSLHIVAVGFVGASDSYFFPVYATALAFLSQALPTLQTRALSVLTAASASALAVSCAPTLLGLRGSLTLEDPRAAQAEYRQVMASLPGSTLVISDLFALPAYTEHADTRIFDYHVYLAGPATRAEWEPISEMVARGRYDVIAMSAGWAEFLDLSKYQRVASVADVSIYQLISESPQQTPSP